MFIKNNLMIRFIIPLMAVSALAFADLPSANQINTYGPVNAPNSDAQSINYTNFFNSSIQPYINSTNYIFTNQNSPTQVKVLTDPNSINITQDSSVRFYYVGASAAFNNSFGVTTNNNFSVNPGDTSLIFANKKSPAGSFVNLPTNLTTAGTVLNLYLLANAGANHGNNAANNLWWSAISKNIDGISHVEVAQFVGTPYYLISWEDLPASSSDLDYNDFSIVMEVIPVPEPATYAILGSLLLGVGIAMKKKSLASSSI